GHGFKSLTEDVEVLYKVDRPYHPASEVTIRWDDPAIGIEWGIANPVLSQKDANALSLEEQVGDLKGNVR
ncbi:MAG: dTDP-4-dehydrorhamnose 3,5-epimerase family protein, partial [Burkholderiaceae bacterium]|nr:dTDP-4-dehydrorhamnose 3,5-epimerase family protein [Burkholderiaceae bacterium]